MTPGRKAPTLDTMLMAGKEAPSEQPAWPHPLRSTDTDTAEAIATALAWYGSWLWE